MATMTRANLGDALVARARADARVASVALIGSAARGEEGEWSDIDVALRLSDGLPETGFDQVIADWTAWLGSIVEIVDTLDISAGGGLYRVFLLGNGLQLDLSFFPYEEFRPRRGEPMLVVAGEPAPEPSPARSFDWQSRVRWGWLLVLHVRSALGRGRLWQAELLLADLRGVVLELAADRLGYRTDHGRSAHLLPEELQERLATARARVLEASELARAARQTTECFVAELECRPVADVARLVDVCRRAARGEMPS